MIASADDNKKGLEAYQFSEQVGHLLRRAYQRHLAIFQQKIPDSQLTSAQFVVLCTARDVEPCSLSDIVKQTAIDQATARGVIERLRVKKLISVSHDPNDRRKVLVALTPSGAAMMRKVVPLAIDITESTFDSLNPAERVVFLFLLRKMGESDLVPDEPSDASRSSD